MGAGRVKDEDFGDINRALARNRWVLSKAARELGITRRQLEYRVKKFNLWPKEES
jgi:Nif-specific regulatory protein